MITKDIKYFCDEDPSLIENYDKAIADTEKVWDLHHRLEIRDNRSYSKKEMMEQGLYYHRPASELIFLTRSEHMKVHYYFTNCDNAVLPKEFSKKVSEGMKKSDKTKNRRWFNNGIVNVLTTKCPEGFICGRKKTK